MGLNLKDKIVVVAGGAGLLGLEFVKAIAEEGAIPVILDKNVKKERDIVAKLKRSDKRTVFMKSDITSTQSLSKVISKLSNSFGKIDALINCAYPKNRNYGRKFENVTYKDFCENVNLHLGGYFLASQQFALFFKKQGYGNIVNIASIYGTMSPRFELYKATAIINPIEYAVIKSSIIHMSKYMAKYFKEWHIRVNCISPGGILYAQPKKFTKRYNKLCLSKGLLGKRDLNGTLIFLLSESSRYINGQNIIVDDGFTL